MSPRMPMSISCRVSSSCTTETRGRWVARPRSEEHTSELQSLRHLVCRLLLEKKNLRRIGIGPGYRVAGYMPNIEERVIAMLRATSTGAAWACLGVRLGWAHALDRVASVAPKV